MTSSTGCSGLMRAGSPPRRTTASRIAARSTTHGTPVKSWSRTLAGVNAISLRTRADASQSASAAMSEARTNFPSSCRSRFSRRIFSANGSLATRGWPARSSAARLKMRVGVPLTTMSVAVEKVSRVGMSFHCRREGGGRGISRSCEVATVRTAPAPCLSREP